MDSKYILLRDQVRSLADTENNYVSVMANTSALLMDTLEDINWAGFYIVMNGMLKVGPFQGHPACVLIGRGKGVCGTAWEKDETIVVPDVHAFPGHIACDSASRSEIVLPLHHMGQVVAVLDIDSPLKERFSDADREGLRLLVQILEERISW